MKDITKIRLTLTFMAMATLAMAGSTGVIELGLARLCRLP